MLIIRTDIKPNKAVCVFIEISFYFACSLLSNWIQYFICLFSYYAICSNSPAPVHVVVSAEVRDALFQQFQHYPQSLMYATIILKLPFRLCIYKKAKSSSVIQAFSWFEKHLLQISFKSPIYVFNLPVIIALQNVFIQYQNNVSL